MRALMLFVVGLAFSSAVYAEGKMITKKSSHSVAVTMDRLEAALKEKEIGVVARVDHAAAAKSLGDAQGLLPVPTSGCQRAEGAEVVRTDKDISFKNVIIAIGFT